MRKFHIDLRLSQEAVNDLAAGKSLVIEDAEDRFVLIPPQEMDCDDGVHDVADEKEDEEDCNYPFCFLEEYNQEKGDKFDLSKKILTLDLAEKMQKLVELLVEIQNRANS